MVWKDVYLYEYINSWEKFNENSLTARKNFSSSLAIKRITYVVYKHVKIAWKDFAMLNLGHYHDVYVQRDLLVPADVFENLLKIN